MSNGDDVLDNWEEIDEAGIDSSVQKLKDSSNSSATCERITTIPYKNSSSSTAVPLTSTVDVNTVTNTKPMQMKLLQRSTTQDSTTTTTTTSSKSSPKSPLDDMSAAFQPVMMVLHKPQDEYQSVNYTEPIANRTVKILRRPTQSSEPRNNGLRPKQPLKTLQQREQEYAEARLRILGSAKNPEDDELKVTTIVATSTLQQTWTTNATPTTPTVTAAAVTSNSLTNLSASNTKINSNKIPGGPNQYNNHYNQQQQYQQNYQSQQQQQQPQNYLYNQQQQQPQSPAYNNNNRAYNFNPLLGLGPMGAIGQPAQYQQVTALQSAQIQQQQQPTQQHLKYQQFHQKSNQQQQQQQHKLQQQQQQQQPQTWSPIVGGSVSSSSIRQQQQQQNDTILRLPRGPDGTTGFQVRR